MNLTHQNVGRDLVELDVLEEVAKDLFERQLVRVEVDLRGELNLIFAFFPTVLKFLIPLSLKPYRIVVARLLAPHEGGLEFRKLIGTQLISAQDETDDVLREECKAAQVQHFIAVFVDEFQNFLDKRLCALVLYVSLGGSQQCTDGVHINAALHEASTCPSQLLQSVIVGCIHYAQ